MFVKFVNFDLDWQAFDVAGPLQSVPRPQYSAKMSVTYGVSYCIETVFFSP
jgi:leucyl aminopeptidase